MSQSSVSNLLKKENKFMSAKEISKILNLRVGTITENLRRLYKHNELIKVKGAIKQKMINNKYFDREVYLWKIK